MAFIRLRMFSCMSWLLRLLFKLSWMNVEFFKCFSFQVFTCFFFFILLIWLITLVDFFHFWTNFPFKGKSHWIGYYGGGALFSQSYPTLVTPWTVAHQAPLFMGFHRQEFLNGLPFPSSGDLSHPGIELMSPALQADSLPTEHWGSVDRLESFQIIKCWPLYTQQFLPQFLFAFSHSTLVNKEKPGCIFNTVEISSAKYPSSTLHTEWLADTTQPSSPPL